MEKPNTMQTLTRRLSGMGARLEKVLGDGGILGNKGRDPDGSSVASVADSSISTLGIDDLEEQRRTVSRGRDAFKSTGRGGAGNIRASPSGGSREPPEHFSPNRGRELAINADLQAKSVGRGGAGNIRSSSRGHFGQDGAVSTISEEVNDAEAYERQVIEEAREKKVVHSTGRGGAGNISNSRSRSRGPGGLFNGSDSINSSHVHSTGRGGLGNIQPDHIKDTDSYASKDEEKLRASRPEGIHSTGRGGLANITDLRSPQPEDPVYYPHNVESSGRGGAGNIRSRSQSRDPDSQNRSMSRDRIAKVWHKVTHQNSPRHIPEERAASVDGFA